VFKTRSLTRSTDYTFLLTSGGHNAGIVSGPVHPKRRHRLLTSTDVNDVPTPEEWLKRAPLHEGSWWPSWEAWLSQHSSAKQGPARPVTVEGGTPAEDAPGRYVHG
jgi:polyhydroxyalkanoate synthase